MQEDHIPPGLPDGRTADGVRRRRRDLLNAHARSIAGRNRAISHRTDRQYLLQFRKPCPDVRRRRPLPCKGDQVTARQPASIEAQLRTQAFARVLGPYIATFTTIYAIRLPDLQGLISDLFAQPALVLMLGALMLGAGLVIIAGHRNWHGPVAITVSLFGWFIALRGFLLIANPTQIQSGVDATLLSPTAMTLARIFFGALAVTGLLLTYAGWFTTPVAPKPPAPTTTTRANSVT